jgi:hypothetical protein
MPVTVFKLALNRAACRCLVPDGPFLLLAHGSGARQMDAARPTA